MGSGDLNLLKSWNPKLVKNREKVWTKEQDLLVEDRKFKERQLEIQKEKELDDLVNASNAKGANERKQKRGLDWMYQSPVGNEDYLLGKKKIDSSLLKNPDSKPVASNIDSVTKGSFIVSEKKKIDHSNDDPMSKFNSAKKLKQNKILKKPTTTTTGTNTYGRTNSRYNTNTNNKSRFKNEDV